jgi:hypothetical protein
MGIDFVVLGVRSNEFHEDTLKPVGGVNDEPEFIAADVENEAVVGNEINRGSELLLDTGRAFPPCLIDHRVPRPQRHLGLGVLFPEKPQRSQSDDLHIR